MTRKVGGKLLLRYEHALIWHRSMHFRLPFFLPAIHNLAKIFMKSPIIANNRIQIFKSFQLHKFVSNFPAFIIQLAIESVEKISWNRNVVRIQNKIVPIVCLLQKKCPILMVCSWWRKLKPTNLFWILQSCQMIYSFVVQCTAVYICLLSFLALSWWAMLIPIKTNWNSVALARK